MKKTYAFPAVLHYADDGISISYPDLPGCTSCSDTTEEAVRDAKEALGLHLWGLEKDDDPIPEPTPVSSLKLKPNEIPLMVDVFMPAIRERLNNAYVKKTLSVPAWLNAQAESAGLNFSQTLQNALKQELKVVDR